MSVIHWLLVSNDIRPHTFPLAQHLKGSSATRNLQSNLPYECVDDDRPRPVRDGERFRFNLVDSDAQCTDSNRDLYEFGEYDDCDNSSKSIVENNRCRYDLSHS